VIVLVIACFVVAGISRHVHQPWHNGSLFFRNGSIQMFGEEYNFDVKQSLGWSGGDARIVIEGLRGNVTVTGDDGPVFALEGHKSIRAFDQASADQANQRARIEMVRDGTDVIVRAVGGTDSDSTRSSYDIDLKVPRKMNFVAHSETDNLTIESLNGNVEVSGEGGNVRLTSIGGNVRVETNRRKDLIRAVGIKGDLDLRGTGTDLQVEDVSGQVTIQGSYYGTLDFRNLTKPLHFESDQTDLRVEKLPGSITMDLGDFRASNFTGALRLRCQARDVHIEDFSSEVEVNVERGDIELSPRRTALAKMDVHVQAGDVELALPEKAAFNLHASTAQGDADNQYGNGVEARSEGRSASMKSASAGGPAITVTTDRGNITVKKS
jgi:DUF4097 and DUF4098 domain-containing protein YvlB